MKTNKRNWNSRTHANNGSALNWIQLSLINRINDRSVTCNKRVEKDVSISVFLLLNTWKEIVCLYLFLFQLRDNSYNDKNKCVVISVRTNTLHWHKIQISTSFSQFNISQDYKNIYSTQLTSLNLLYLISLNLN